MNDREFPLPAGLFFFTAEKGMGKIPRIIPRNTRHGYDDGWDRARLLPAVIPNAYRTRMDSCQNRNHKVI